MLRKILVPLDGSALSEQALTTAAALAEATQARLVLVQAVWATALPGMDAAPAQLEAVARGQAYLNRTARRLQARGLAVETAVPFAHAAEGILLEIGLNQADLVIMTTHGRSGLGQWVYGSVAETVLANSPAPVWLIRSAKTPAPASAGDAHATRILVPLDGSAFAEAVLPYAAAVARALDWTLALMRVVTPPALADREPTLVNSLTAEKQLIHAQDEAQVYLASVAAPLRQEGVTVQTRLAVGEAAEAILEESWTSHVALVAMATHGHTGLARLLYGSVAHAVLHRGASPILLVRPDKLIAVQAEPVAQTTSL